MVKINQINELGANSKSRESKGYVIDNKASGCNTVRKNELHTVASCATVLRKAEL